MLNTEGKIVSTHRVWIRKGFADHKAHLDDDDKASICHKVCISQNTFVQGMESIVFCLSLGMHVTCFSILALKAAAFLIFRNVMYPDDLCTFLAISSLLSAVTVSHFEPKCLLNKCNVQKCL